jgi:hypothetical protein
MDNEKTYGLVLPPFGTRMDKMHLPGLLSSLIFHSCLADYGVPAM